MTSNYLERLVAEWYEYYGYFVLTNVCIGKRAKGGSKCEFESDVEAFHRRYLHKGVFSLLFSILEG